MKAPVSFILLLAVSLFLNSFVSVTLAEELSRPTYKVIEELDVKVTMRDGIRLSTNIYRPDAEGEFPTLLLRTPYRNEVAVIVADIKDARYLAERGYVAIIQDTRGRFKSEGLFSPYFFEAEDGLDTQKWVSEQPWCNGKIGTWGSSYRGGTQWLPALEGSPYVDAMFTKVPCTENYTVSFQNGALSLRLLTSWCTGMTAPYNFKLEEFQKHDIEEVNRFLPLIEQDTKIGWYIPFWRDEVNHPEDDAYWSPLRFEGKYSNVHSAVYIVAGWYDLFTMQNLKSFVEMTKSTIAPAVRSKQKIIVGPWGHGALLNINKLGDLDYGEEAVIDMSGLMLRWFDYHIKGVDNGIMNEPPIRLFVMGDNVWRFENEWPLKRTVYKRYYFHSAGHASTKNGDGTLSKDLPRDEPSDRFVYDPDNPVPSMPDSSVFDGYSYNPIDHSRLEVRPDILVYSTSPLERDIEVTGPLDIILYAASSAVNTDFTGKLLDVYPDGRAIYIRDGIIRASFRDGPRNTSNIEPGKVYEYHIDLWATSNVFKKGHRIRVEISSSNFPRFDRNLNTGRNFATETEWMKAEQTIYHNEKYPSCIMLPVIPR